MRTTLLGSTGIELCAIGLGEMPLSIRGRPSEEDAIEVIRGAVKAGINFIDTADSYCIDENDKHHGERLIAKALAGIEEEVFVATKGGLMRPEGRWETNGDPLHLERTVRESFEALGGEQPIFLWQHHAPDRDFSIKVSLAPIAKAVKEGVIRYVGVSNYSVEEIKAAREIVEVVSVQNQYSPWYRKPEQDGVLEYCESEGLMFIPWSPFGGMHRAKSLEEYPGAGSIAVERGVSPHQVVLAWLLSKSPSILPIPGASRLESIQDCLKALDLSLSDEEISRFRA